MCASGYVHAGVCIGVSAAACEFVCSPVCLCCYCVCVLVIFGFIRADVSVSACFASCCVTVLVCSC